MTGDRNPIDVPIDQCAADAAHLVEKHPGSLTFQKFTCAHCGSRQTMEAPNTFYRSGTCEQCGKVSPITHCNFLAALASPGEGTAILGAIVREQRGHTNS